MLLKQVSIVQHISVEGEAKRVWCHSLL